MTQLDLKRFERLEAVYQAAKTLCDGWADLERRWLHISVQAQDINYLREAVEALEPKEPEQGRLEI